MNFTVTGFEGPMELLLHLIAKHKMDIEDIPIASLLEQYMAFIEAREREDLELDSSFIEMAARLIYIKSASLLPKNEEAKELTMALSRELMELKLCKAVASLLRERWQAVPLAVRKPIELPVDLTYKLTHSPTELYDSFMGIRAKKPDVLQEKSKDTVKNLVSTRIVSVGSKIVSLLRKLYRGKPLDATTLFMEDMDKSELVATFLALLELIRAGRATFNSEESVIVPGDLSRRGQTTE